MLRPTGWFNAMTIGRLAIAKPIAKSTTPLRKLIKVFGCHLKQFVVSRLTLEHSTLPDHGRRGLLDLVHEVVEGAD